jgi:hypothetical protein
MLEDIPKMDFKFTPEEKKLEHKLVREERRKINEMDIPEGEKERMRNIWLDYIMMYDIQYNAHQKGFSGKNVYPILN